MSNCCLFDLLPIELVHTLFEYFFAHEIYFIFFNVSNHLNSVLQSYTAYHVDLKSIGKVQFDLICRHIQSEQVISLTLCDDINTYGQSEFFLTHFQIKKFTELRSLTLIKIDFELAKYIVSNLHKFNKLCSLSFDDGSIKYRYPVQTETIDDYLTDINTEVLSKVKCLSLGSTNLLLYTTLPRLRHLKLKECTIDDLNSIFQQVSQLKSLSVGLNLHKSKPELNFSPKSLTRLSLEINNSRIPMHGIKEILLKMPNLKHLELKLDAENDIADGYQWQILIASFITFNFKFNLLSIDRRDILDSFRTPFWLEEKRWFVACQHRSLFSIPHFAPVSIDSLKLSSIRSTAPYFRFIRDKLNRPLIFSHVHKFLLNTKNINTNHRFTHIKILELEIPIPFRNIEPDIDLNQVEHLILPSLNNLLTFIPLTRKLPQLYKLTITNGITNDMIAEIKCYQFERILELEINIIDESNHHIMKELFRLFPCIKYLRCTSYIKSKASMIYLIDGFKDLSNATFCVNDSFIKHESNFCQSRNTIIEHSKRLLKGNFIYRIYQPSILCDLYDIVWWIEENLSTNF